MKKAFFLLFPLLVVVSLGIMGCELVDPELDTAAATDRISEQAAEADQSSDPAPAPSGTSSEEFLWKPVSEGDGNLVVLLPSSLRGDVTGCTVGSEQGRFAGDTHNGNRPHYRFNNPGAAYGTDITVTATLKNGEARTWSIPDGSQRTTY